MAEYHALTEKQMFALDLLCASDYYFDAIESCFSQCYGADAANVVRLLAETGKAYANYLTGSKSQADRNTFTSAFNALKAAYTDLADKTEFDNDFEDIYAFYAAKTIIESVG